MSAYQAAAEPAGVELVVASEAEHGLVPRGTIGLSLRLPADDAEVSLLAEAARALGVSGVVATDDATVELASRAARAIGCRHNSPESVRAARRKDLARAALVRAGAPTPWFRTLPVGGGEVRHLAGIPFPCVVKPLALSGSRGVIRCDSPEALVAAIPRVAAIVAGARDPEERHTLLVEGFIAGREVALEGILRAGELHVLALFDKPDPLEGPYFEETIYVTPSRLPIRLRERVVSRAQEAVRAYGLREGPVHAEARVGESDATILEIAPRTIGGDCARLLQFGTGRSLEELVLRYAVGREVPIRPIEGAAGVMMIPTPGHGTLRRVEGVLSALRVPLVEDVVIAVREGYELVPLPEGSSYLGFIFARGRSPEAVEAALREAHDKLRVVVAPAWRLTPR